MLNLPLTLMLSVSVAGMLIEIMAGKAGALHGVHQDASPFEFDEDQPAVDYFGDQLKKANCT